MNDLGNKYAEAALKERRAVMAGEIVTTERRLRYLRQGLKHIDGALRLFNPDSDPTKIAAKRPYRRVKLFGAGKLNRLILDALREGARPMALLEIVGSIVATLGYGEEAAKGMRNRVRANLLYLTSVRGMTVKMGERVGAKWALNV
jgi:hypothetical protein